MNILFIHGNYPAQFKNLAAAFGKQEQHNVLYITARKDSENHPISGVKIVRYSEKEHAKNNQKSEAQSVSDEMIGKGEIIIEVVIKLVKDGFRPDIVFFHGGNGLGLFLREFLPGTNLIGYFEWYFSKRCANIILGRSDLSAYKLIRARNFCTENEIMCCNACVVPTKWQASQFPKKLRQFLTVIFDGIDTDFFQPNKNKLINENLQLIGENNSVVITPDDLLITYATRGMEPLRGFPEFMRLLPRLLEEYKNLKVIIGGRDRSAYGPSCPTHNGSWKSMMLDELPVLKDHRRITFTGLMNYNNYKSMLQRTNLHCYFTHPYVTSWSLFEAAACGSPILTNNSPATNGTITTLQQENIIDSIESLNTDKGYEAVCRILNTPSDHNTHIDNSFTTKHSMQQWEALINSLLSANLNK